MTYRVIVLNSASVNAFALPSGQLYVTRGLIALANDTSELASVLSHEMSHVIARHAAMREDEAARDALVKRVFTDRAQRSGDQRAGAGQVEDQAGELLARAGARSGRHRRRHRGARRLRSLTARCASSPRWGAMPSSRRRPARPASIRARPTSSPRIRRRPSASRPRKAMLVSSPVPAPASATRRPISPASTASPTARTRAKASCAGGGSCIPSSASPS